MEFVSSGPSGVVLYRQVLSANQRKLLQKTRAQRDVL